MSERLTKKGKRIGRPPRHGGYSILARRGDVPSSRRHVRAYLETVRAGLVRDLGPTENDLTAAQKALLNHVISKIAITRLIEERLAEVGIFKPTGELDPSLGKFFLTASNSLRLDLLALGLNTRRAEEVLDLGRYIESKALEPASNSPAQETGGGEIARPGASLSEIPDDEGPEEGSGPPAGGEGAA